MHDSPNIDYAIIGGGIVGLATALELLQRQPDVSLMVIEKEDRFGQHQTGHNSGVIHAGIYYEPGSLKARFCREGVDETIRFCTDNDIPFEQCGKLIVATDDLEHERMLDLHRRGLENQLDLELLDVDQLSALEPNIRGTGAILVKTTGIVNYAAICEKMADRIRDLGGLMRLGRRVKSITESEVAVTLQLTDGESVRSSFVIACTGLQADRTVAMMGIPADFRIVPYRGEYYQLPAEKADIVRHLIYPVPNPDLPFLGVHLTRMIDGSVTVGPNAVQGWKREGYGRVNFDVRDVTNMLGFPGFWRASLQNLRPGLVELRNSLWKRGYLKQVRKYCPSIEIGDLQPYPAGIRAQAVMRNGEMVHDFLFAQSRRSLHVCNAPSPAATSAIPIGRHIVDKVLERAPA